MPLNTIIAKFLGSDEKYAGKILELLTIEECWHKEYEFREGKYTEVPGGKLSVANIVTQADLIGFLQAVGQGSWFKGHDRSQIAPHDPQKNLDAYYQLFQSLGLMDPVEYPATLLRPPEFSAVLGTSEAQMQRILFQFQQDMDSGRLPTQKIVFGLGSDRPLGQFVSEAEQTSKNKLLAQGKPLIGMAMVDLLINEVLLEKAKKDAAVAQLIYQSIIAYAELSSTKVRATTADTVIVLKGVLEELIAANPLLQKLHGEKQKIIILFYGRQPYINRQINDIRFILGDDYLAVGVGVGMSLDYFKAGPANINICLGEIARFIHALFIQPDMTARLIHEFNVELTEAEQQELANWCVLRLGSLPV